ncbi:hypothetical protein CALCODRAFT_509664 [Calocera cornea HHB12733]|uniref:TPR-like protein n=1 Tax=Calocera cornea HHB12733 TaxID=1353952 RepID=A0A165F339_9BASI|nr:hypothetical protein CALCODRAFT_509664 [Calocera cornea HHB12733]
MSTHSARSGGRRTRLGGSTRSSRTGRAPDSDKKSKQPTTQPRKSGESEPSRTNENDMDIAGWLQRYLSDMGVPINPVLQRVKEGILSMVGIREELETRQSDVELLVVHALWVAKEVLAKLSPARIPDDASRDALQMLARTVTDVQAFLQSLQSKDANSVTARLGSAKWFLLVLDNFETVLETADSGEVERFLGKLAEISNLSIILTMRGSQPPDGVAWEGRFRQTLDRLSMEASRQIWFALGGGDDDKLDELLEKLDGLPLAIRLMASQAQLSEQSPAELLEAYAVEATKLLKTRGVGKLRSLEVSIRLSLECRTMAEAPEALRLLSILCMLPDGSSLDHLRAMAHSMRGTLVTSVTVLLHVALAWKEKGRLRVLSPIRDFILDEHPPEDKLLQEMRGYFTGLVLQAFEAGPQSQTLASAVLSTECGNLTSVFLHSWSSIVEGDYMPLLRSSLVLAEVSYYTGYGNCVSLLEAAKTKAHYGEAVQQLEEARAIFETLGNPLGVAKCQSNLGAVLHAQNHCGEAVQQLEEARAIFQDIGDRLGVARCKQRLGDILRQQSHYEEAAHQLEEAREIYQSIGSRLGVAVCLAALGGVLRMQNHYAESAQLLEEGRALFQAIGDRLGMANCARTLGEVLLMQNHCEEASQRLEEAREIFQAIGDRVDVATCTRELGEVLLMQKHYVEAAPRFEEARAIQEAVGDCLGLANCTWNLGQVLLFQNHYEEAAQRVQQARVIYKAIGNRRGEANCTQTLGDVLHMQNHYGQAAQQLEEAKAAFEAIKDRRGVANCSWSIGLTLSAQGRAAEAEFVFLQCLRVYEEMHLPKEAEEVREELTQLRATRIGSASLPNRNEKASP